MKRLFKGEIKFNVKLAFVMLSLKFVNRTCGTIA